MSKDTLRKIAFLVLGIAVVLQLILPFIYPIVGDDAWVHLNWIEQFPKLFLSGQFYPRMLPEGFWGFGSPAFYFYPPLTGWLASVAAIVIESPVVIFRVLEFCGLILSVCTCFFYLRSLKFKKQQSLLGAIIYGVFPYRIIDLYLRSALGEHLSFIFIPLILLGIEIALNTRLSEKRKIFAAITISIIGWAGILLVNVPASIIMLYGSSTYALVKARKNKEYKHLLIPAMGAIVGALIASIYYLPAMAYSASIKLSHLWDVQRSFWNITDAFRGIFEGVHHYFSAALVANLVMALCLCFMIPLQEWKKEKSATQSIFLVLLSYSVLFQIPFISSTAFNFLPFSKYIQFGFRWDILLVITAAFYVGRSYQEGKEITLNIFILAVSVITIFIGIGSYLTESKVGWKYSPTSEHMDAPEYLPASANDNFVAAKDLLKQHASDPAVFALDDSSKVQVISATPSAIEFSTKESTAPVKAVFHRISFPTWALHTMQGEVIILSSDSLGRITSVLPAQADRYKLSLEEGPIERVGKIISIAGLSLFLLSLLLTIFSRNPKAS